MDLVQRIFSSLHHDSARLVRLAALNNLTDPSSGELLSAAWKENVQHKTCMFPKIDRSTEAADKEIGVLDQAHVVLVYTCVTVLNLTLPVGQRLNASLGAPQDGAGNGDGAVSSAVRLAVTSRRWLTQQCCSQK